MTEPYTTDGSYRKRYTALVDDFLRFATDSAAQTWLEGEFGEWAQRLSPELRQALVAYKNSDYQDLNDNARDGFELPQHHLVDQAIASHTLSRPVICYRGIIDGDQGIHEFVPGAEVRDLGYWSLSMLEDVAWGFASTGSTPTSRVVFRVFLAAGTQVIKAAAPDIIEEMHEYELLLPRGSRFEVMAPATAKVAAANNATYYTIDVELIE